MTRLYSLSTRATGHSVGKLGVLSVHLDGARCRVECDFCYLGQRKQAGATTSDSPDRLGDLIGDIDFDELAVALSEPVAPVRGALEKLIGVARRKGRPLTV